MAGELATRRASLWRRVTAAATGLFRASDTLSWGQIVKRLFSYAGDDSVGRPMEQNTWVYIAVSANARCVAGLDWKLVRTGDEDQEVTSGPAYELINRPARDATAEDLIEEFVGHLCESGEAHVFDGDAEGLRSGSTRPTELLVVGRRQMTPKFAGGSGELLWWDYTPARGDWQRVPILPEQHAYMRMFNPYDAYRGLSPLRAAELGIRQDYRAARFNDAALANNGSPGGLIVFPDRVSKEEGAEYLKDWEDQLRGARNARRTRVIGGGVDYKQMAMTNIDLALYEGRKFNREEIFSAIGVPPVVCFVFDSAHYQIGDAAQEVWIHGTIEPLVKKICGLFNVILLPRIEPGVKLVIDVNSHHVIQKIEQGKLETLNKALRSGVPYNEAKDLLNLRLDDQAWGTQSFLESGLATPDQIVEGLGGLAPIEEEEETEQPESEESEEGEEGEEGSGFRVQEAEIAATIAGEKRVEEAQIRKQLPRIRQRYRAHFIRQEREIQRRLRRALGNKVAKSQGNKSSGADTLSPSHLVTLLRPWEKAGGEAERVARRVLLRLTSEQARLRKMFAEYFPRAVEGTLRAELKRLGLSRSAIEGAIKKLKSGKYVQMLMRAKAPKVANIERTTRGRLHRTLVEGIGKGETVSELSSRVHGVLGGDRARALRIARTEAGEAVSTARFVAASAAGAKRKGWITGRNPRPTHLAAGQNYHPRTNPIAMDERFKVGKDRLMFPRDPAGSAGEIINCNCVMVTARKKKEGSGSEIVNAIGAGCGAPA